MWFDMYLSMRSLNFESSPLDQYKVNLFGDNCTVAAIARMQDPQLGQRCYQMCIFYLM